MKIALLAWFVVLSGCAGSPSLPAAASPANLSAQRTGPAGTAKVGLPLTRAQKIGLWSGVAVLLGYLMAEDDDTERSPEDRAQHGR